MANKFFALIISLFLGFSALAQQRKEVPAYKGHINDFANVLQAEEVAQIEKKLLDYEDSTSVQIAVVIEKNLNGRSEFDRAMDFARGWGVGQQEKRNGVVIYIAIEDRKFYIVTADRTQGALPDGKLGEIFRSQVRPSFQAQQYAQGINNGVDAIILALAGEFKADPKAAKSKFPFILVLLLIFILIFLFSKKGGDGTGGMSRGGTYWFPSTGGGWIGGGVSSRGGGSSWGGFGGGGGFNGGGAGGSW